MSEQQNPFPPMQDETDEEILRALSPANLCSVFRHARNEYARRLQKAAAREFYYRAGIEWTKSWRRDWFCKADDAGPSHWSWYLPEMDSVFAAGHAAFWTRHATREDIWADGGHEKKCTIHVCRCVLQIKHLRFAHVMSRPQWCIAFYMPLLEYDFITPKGVFIAHVANCPDLLPHSTPKGALLEGRDAWRRHCVERKRIAECDDTAGQWEGVKHAHRRWCGGDLILHDGRAAADAAHQDGESPESVMWHRSAYTPNVCALCGNTGQNVHHNTYERCGFERVQDLMVLCRKCHMRHHCVLPESS